MYCKNNKPKLSKIVNRKNRVIIAKVKILIIVKVVKIVIDYQIKVILHRPNVIVCKGITSLYPKTYSNLTPL